MKNEGWLRLNSRSKLCGQSGLVSIKLLVPAVYRTYPAIRSYRRPLTIQYQRASTSVFWRRFIGSISHCLTASTICRHNDDRRRVTSWLIDWLIDWLVSHPTIRPPDFDLCRHFCVWSMLNRLQTGLAQSAANFGKSSDGVIYRWRTTRKHTRAPTEHTCWRWLSTAKFNLNT